ncbi:VIT domain-containing protein [Empedobacter sp. GD03739]|uniref:VIT domain-containing protein n=1 Tax=Empedobacter sp. GD03739 TaxID=2975376 RepID=UPI00244AA43F|nr:VIT domain-containing protein [Empedobacter sp. GD03739]MDH1603667.1 VIT domain-containing protein [Empedobacter sp. GD03739]
MKKLFSFFFVFVGMFFSTKINAQDIRIGFPRIEIGERPDENSVSLQSMNVQVEIFGNLAKTTTTLVFTNSSSRNLEGNLVFPLPENTTVSGYAIDINGKLRNAVPVTKVRAVEVFESIQKQNIDPGIIEKVEGNNFRTRISPIPAKGSRTIQLSYYQELKLDKSSYQYHLPLDSSKKIAKFNLTTKVYNAAGKPQLIETPDGSFNFSENSNIYEANLSKTDFTPKKSLIINLPKSPNNVESFVQKNVDGSVYFYANLLVDAKSQPKVWSKNIGIIWDNSLSGLKRNHQKELEFLDKIISQQKNLNIEVSLLNFSLEKSRFFQIKNGDWSELKKYLENVTYDGGTNYAKILPASLKADEYLLFSDGISSFGSNIFNIDKPFYTIASSPTSNYGVLKMIAQKVGGKFINLNENSVENAFKQINESSVQFLGIINNTAGEVYPISTNDVNNGISISGISQYPNAKLMMMFGRNGKVEFNKELDLSKATQNLEISKIWAQSKVNYLELNLEQYKTEIEEIGKQFSIVTSNTSLIVLENVSDYVKYKINPPAELQSEFNKLSKQGFEQNETRKADLLKNAIAKAKELKEWWKKDFKYIKPKYPKPVGDSTTYLEETVQVNMVMPEPRTTAVMEMESSAEQAMVVTANGVRRESRSLGYASANFVADKKMKDESSASVPEIKIVNVKSDKEYMKLIEASKNPYQTYLDLRKDYAETPAYYFDVATFFFQKKEKETGLKILSSIADLGLEDAELYKMLAYKLKEIEEYQTELFITKKVLDWRPFDAQSYRDYALALQDNEQYQSALEYLYKVLTNDYSVEIANRDRDITEIIVPEVNNLISLHRKELNLSKINKDIIVDIPVDIRVVMNWNKDMTDIDLWVTDPNGEKCFYGHRTTAIGGRMSEDVTQGFGPEQFMLKKAIKGKYKIETNFFGERQMSISGPTTISAEIYLMYSSGKQVKKMITFQNNKPNSGGEGILVGEFEF